MKVQNKLKIKLPDGRKTGIVYCKHQGGAVIIARKYVSPKPSEQNARFASVNANLFALAPSDGYKRDLRAYIDAYNSGPQGQESPLRSWNNLYIKIMSALARMDKAIDLRSISREEIIEQNLPCNSLKRAVQAGLLPKVKGWEKLNSEF